MIKTTICLPQEKREEATEVVLEPAGWFLVWAAFDFLFYYWQELRKERNKFKALSEAHMHFRPLGPY